MTCISNKTGEICGYSEFRQESIKPRRTERAQRAEIESSLNKLTEQGDYWSLDIIRRAATALADDSAGKESNYNLLFLLRDVVMAKPGEMIFGRRK